MLKNVFFKISFACAVTAFFAACSTPTVSSDDDDGVYRRVKSSSSGEATSSSSEQKQSVYDAVVKSGVYTTKDSVAAYLCKFDKLPSNYIGKDEAITLVEEETGREFTKWNFNPWTAFDFMVGGDVYENSDGLLPKGFYHEADVDYYDSSRGTKRLVYASDCVIYYTADHYKSFKKLDVR
jgi:guanyl-specific ribonuclease Sa